MFLTPFILIPGIAVSIFIGFIFKEVVFIEYLSYLVLIVYNMVVSTIILFFTRGIFEVLEIG